MIFGFLQVSSGFEIDQIAGRSIFYLRTKIKACPIYTFRLTYWLTLLDGGRTIKRTTLNFVIDAVGFAGFVFLTTTGVLVRYVLPPGSGRRAALWGMNRHEWGDLHFWIAIVFFCVLGLHLFLHWRWIVHMVRGKPREGSGLRFALGLVGILAVLAIALTPYGGSVEQTGTSSVQREESSALIQESEFVRGRMTLIEIEQKTGVPQAYLIEHLGMPKNVQLDEGVAKLGKSFGFDIDDVRRIIGKYKAQE